MTRRDLQQLIDAVAGGVVFITRQLQAYAGDFDRYRSSPAGFARSRC
jgi:hypothetical protein